MSHESSRCDLYDCNIGVLSGNHIIPSALFKFAFNIFSSANRFDFSFIQACFLPGLYRSKSQGIVIGIHSICPIVLSKILPKLFNWIKLRRIWWQIDQSNILRQLNTPGGMKACLIPNHNNMNIRLHFFFEFPEKGIY